MKPSICKISSKQLERAEKKKRKLSALAKIVELNDKDRLAMAKKERNSDDNEISEGNELLTQEFEDASFIKVKHKNKSWKRNGNTNLTCLESNQQKDLINHEDEQPMKRMRKGSATTTDSESKELEMPRPLTDEEYTDLRRKLRERKRELDDVPHLQLREIGQRALLTMPQEQRTPVFLTDIQHLLMTALIGNKSPCLPDRWCLLQKSSKLSHSLVLIVDGISLYHYVSNESKFEETNKIFETRLEVVIPTPKNGPIVEKMAQVPLTNMQARVLIQKYGSLETAITMNQDPTLFVQNIFPIESQTNVLEKSEINLEDNSTLPPTDKFPRTKLLLSALQMVDEGYPMPLTAEMRNRFGKYLFTQKKYEPVTNHSPMFGVDCEMCVTSANISELTRISIVNEKLETVYESLVRPKNKIVNYLTQFSGITPELMATVTKDLKTVQNEIMKLLPPDAILVGQSLQFDLHAMQMMHPYVIDTSICFNLTGVRRRKSKLQQLAKILLKETIQEGILGHDSVEDSLAALKLIQLKLANSIEYGDAVLVEKRRLQELLGGEDNCALKNNMIAYASKRDKCTAIITNGELKESTKDVIKKAEEAAADKLKSVHIFETESNKKTIKKAREIAMEHALTIANIKIEEKHTTLDALDTTIAKLDKWIDKLWKSVAHNGLFLVLMGGASDCPNGVAKIAIKKNIADVAAEVPMTT